MRAPPQVDTPPVPGADHFGRLARAILDRRAELGRTQLDVARAGGPSNATLTALESGRATSTSPATLRKLDAGLDWHPGSAQAVLAGGEVRPRERPSPATFGLSAELRVVSDALAQVHERIDEIHRALRGVEDTLPGAGGHQAHPGSWLALRDGLLRG